MLGATDCRTVLEIGPALGLVTSLLVNIGYDVATLDRGPRSFAYPDVLHFEKDICEYFSGDIAGYDAILCCKTSSMSNGNVSPRSLPPFVKAVQKT